METNSKYNVVCLPTSPVTRVNQMSILNPLIYLLILKRYKLKDGSGFARLTSLVFTVTLYYRITKVKTTPIFMRNLVAKACLHNVFSA